MKYNCKITKSNRKSICIKINNDLSLDIRAPFLMTNDEIEMFVEKHQKWIDKNIPRVEAQVKKIIDISPKDIAILKQNANIVLQKKIDYWSYKMGLKYNGFKITSAKTRMGSCSYKNNICFSYRLMLYSDMAQDYVVVHELAHIVYKNHKKEFYNLISRYIPNYKECINEFKK